MADKTVAAWAQQKGLQTFADRAMLLTRGYVFTYAAAINGNGAYVVSTPVREEDWSKDKKKELKTALKKTGTVAYVKGLVQVTISALTKNGRVEKLEAVTDILPGELERLQLRPGAICKHCGKEECDDYLLDGAVYYPAHSRCKEEMAEELIAQVEENLESGNVMSGLLGGLLGGLVGCIPSVITAFFFDTIYGLLFALIPLAAYKGYQICKGLMNAAVPYIISILSIICTVLLVITYQYLYFASEVGEFLIEAGVSPFGFFMEYLFSGEGLMDLVSDLAIPLVFCGIGIMIAWRSISQGNKHKQEAAEMLRTSTKS